MNYRNKRVVLVIVLVMIGVPMQRALASGAVPRFEPSVCPFGAVSSLQIDCGYVLVPEDHARPDGTTIRLAIAILRSPNPNKAPDPIFFLAGGPGGAFVSTAPVQTQQNGLAAMLTERDIVIVDQRGMGLSEPQIECRIYDSVFDLFAEDFPSPKVAERLKQCREGLKARGINVDAFNSVQNAADFDSIRQALGYEQVNLYGVSYGTLLGLLALRDHPQGIRSVILFSTLPPNAKLYEDAPAPFQNAFNRLIANCNADLVCHTAYPDLRGRYQQVWEKLQANPVPIGVNGQTFLFDGRQLVDTVTRALGTPTGPKTLPGQIYEFADGNFESLKPFFKQVAVLPPDQLPKVTLYAAMTCGQFAAHTTAPKIAATQANYPAIFKEAGPVSGLRDFRVCEAWGTDLAASNASAVSDIPVLLLSGEYDTFTAPEWTALAAKTLSRSTAIQFPGMGHAFGTDVCAQQIMLSFLKDPNTKPDPSCIVSMPPVNFAISLSVTRPIIQGSAGLFGIVALWGLTLLTLAFAHGYRQIAWRVSLRRAGWLPVIGVLTAVAVISLDPHSAEELMGLSPLQLVIPLALAIQAALIFSPDDEPGLEMLLAASRPVSWLVLERLAAAFLVQGATALICTAIVSAFHPQYSAGMLLLSWIPSALFLSGLALFVTLRTRVVAFGAVIAGFVWAIFFFFGGAFMPGQTLPFPFSILQPFLWAFNINAKSTALTAPDFLLNRLFLAVTGICLIMLALRSVRDSEQILLDASRKRRRKQNTVLPTNVPHVGILRNRAAIQPVPTSKTLRTPLYQLAGMIWYEFKMHWRRRTFKIATGIMILGGSVLTLMVGAYLNQLIPGLPPLDSLPVDQAQIIRGITLVALGTSSVLWTLCFILPVLVVDTVPVDAAVRETLGTLPLNNGVYLAGKVAGVWLAGLSSVILSATILGVLWWWRVGSFNAVPLADMLLFGALPLLLLNSTFSVLIGATQPNRRRAFVLLIFAVAIPAMTAGVVHGLDFIVPGNLALMNHYMISGIQGMLVIPPALPTAGILDSQMQRTILVGIVQLVVVGAAVLFIRGNQRDYHS